MLCQLSYENKAFGSTFSLKSIFLSIFTLRKEARARIVLEPMIIQLIEQRSLNKITST